MSHTASISGSKYVREALCRQTRAVQTHDLEETLDTVQAFRSLKRPRGRRIGIVGIGGAGSVRAADDCESAGLAVPLFPAELRGALSAFTTIAGTSVRNPVDTSAEVYWDEAALAKTIDLIARHDGIDILFIILNTLAGIRRGVDSLKGQSEVVVTAASQTGKPTAIVIPTCGIDRADQMAKEAAGHCVKAGFPVYRSSSRAARAVSHLVSYHEHR